LRNIGRLTTGEDQAQWIAQGIHACMDLGSQPTARAAERLIATVFFDAPAECWCARTTVESMNSSSRSASPWRASATRDQTPLASHRAKRTYTECQFPNLVADHARGFQPAPRIALPQRTTGYPPLAHPCPSACPATVPKYEPTAHRSTCPDPWLTRKFQM
jgi:hypothetical protein